MGADYSWMSDSGGGTGISEHVVVQLLAGDIENVRARLAGALERMGYQVIADEPILKARRGARNWAAGQASANILEYPITVTVWLKSDRPNLTRATFEYVVKYPWLMRGDKQVLSQEARTIIALAATRARATVCAGCGTEATDDSRFCRRCGAPMTAGAPEVEMLRLLAETNAGRSSVLAGQWLLLSSLLLALIGIILFAVKGESGIKPFVVLESIALGIGLFSWISLLFGAHRLSRALNPVEQERNQLPGYRQPPVTARADTDPLRLSAPPSSVSVTEGTTALMEERERKA